MNGSTGRDGQRHGTDGGRPESRPPALARAAIMLGPLLLVVILAAACGSVPATAAGGTSGARPTPSPSASGAPGATAAAESASSGHAQPALCQDAAAVTSLLIVRTQRYLVPQHPQPQHPQSAPNRLVVAKAGEARAVARALCALPALPRGLFSCPILLPATTYDLLFAVGSRRLPVVVAEATGCETVTGVGPARQAVTSPGLWRLLAAAAALGRAGRQAFTGTTPVGGGCRLATQPNKILGCPSAG